MSCQCLKRPSGLRRASTGVIVGLAQNERAVARCSRPTVLQHLPPRHLRADVGQPGAAEAFTVGRAEAPRL